VRRLGALLALVLALLGASAPARAAVTIDFYSHELTLVARGLNTYFPHALVILRGTTDDGTRVDANYGFTARTVFINILWQRVTGEMDPTPLPTGYLDGADRRFSFTLTDAQYRAVLATVERWKNWPQPSYDIDERNCVIFIKEIAQAVGLSVSDEKRFVRAPSDFLLDVAQRNAAFLSAQGPQPALMQQAGQTASQAPSQAQSLQDRVRALEAARDR
jgi:hypothetical protein